LLDGYMEDLATDRIYRLMIAQRVLHRDLVPVQDAHGQTVKHTPQFITQLFDEELARLLSALPTNADPDEADRFRRAREISEAMIVNGEFNPA
jgi:malate synthase